MPQNATIEDRAVGDPTAAQAIDLPKLDLKRRLSSAEAQSRLAQYGPNALDEKVVSPLERLL